MCDIGYTMNNNESENKSSELEKVRQATIKTIRTTWEKFNSNVLHVCVDSNPKTKA
jgi:hypothetical protein